ncbi:MAG: AraC family transcriptional regulator [Clostridia bacterium]|nr:AraC family transcriptional regulator [Clostridia bacterium]
MNSNICKFYTPSLSDSILIHCFVLESNLENLSSSNPLKKNRMLLIIQGDGTLSINQKNFDFRTGDLIFAFPDEQLSHIQSNNASLIYIDFSGNRAESLLHRFDICKSNRFFDNLGGTIPLWKESLFRASSENVDLAAESVILHTLSCMRAEKTTNNDTVSAILKIIENDFNDHNLSIVSIGKELSYHPKYLSSLFKKEMGVSFSEYLRNKRINYARLLFDHGIDSIKNVALLSGFNDPLYFSSTFKKVIGVSPKQYLQRQES